MLPLLILGSGLKVSSKLEVPGRLSSLVFLSLRRLRLMWLALFSLSMRRYCFIFLKL